MAFHGEIQPHFVLLPFMAQGHLIPMVDIARLLAKRDVIVTILLTPKNANRVKNVIDRAVGSGLGINVVHLKFPCIEAGVPEGCESFDMLPNGIKYLTNFVKAITMLREQVEQLLKELKPLPSCLIADSFFPWATDMALQLHVPRIVFHGTSCFSLLCIHIMINSKDVEAITSDTDYFVLPDIPGRIEITKAQLRGSAEKVPPEFEKIWKEANQCEEEALGTVANTFQELEPEYVEEYAKARGKKIWCIGPVSLCNQDDLDKAERGNKALVDEKRCLKWLDLKELGSVVYVCLGSLSQLSTSQLIELGLGLEASNRPFIWVIKDATDAFETWLLEEKFEQRTNGRGLLIQGWAPQMLILSHPSVGGFITHCGWNSTLEGLTAGLPMITWPVFGEQFCNEKLIVNVIKTGIRAGVEVPIIPGEHENVVLQVKSDDIKMVVDRLMDGGQEAEERRERARKLREMAKLAVEKGGSSYNNLTQLIQEIVMLQAERRGQHANNTK